MRSYAILRVPIMPIHVLFQVLPLQQHLEHVNTNNFKEEKPSHRVRGAFRE